jgi:raffinose/stachyose/melibiose transport system permease protein
MKRQNPQERIVLWGFVTPTLFAFAMVLIVPFIMGVIYAFTNWTGIRCNPVNFTGLINFKNAFADLHFYHAFGLTALYAVVSMAVVNLVAFCMAMLVTQELKLKNIYRTGFFLPNLIGGLVLGYIWQFIFNAALPKLGDALHWSFLHKSLLTEPRTAFFAIVFVAAWQYAGYIMMIYIAALQSVPVELNEAASIDGATGWQRLRHITFPMASFLTLVNAFKMFDVNVSLTNGLPSTQFMGASVPGTELMAMNIYNTAFQMNRMAQGQAKAVIFFVVLVIVSLVQVYFNKKREVEM